MPVAALQETVSRLGLPAPQSGWRASVVVVFELVAHGQHGDIGFVLDLEQNHTARSSERNDQFPQAALLNNYESLKAQGIEPYWCIHHGITVSMYYADPDGNQMELQVDCYPSAERANAFMESPHFAVNPIGVEYDPEEWARRLDAGESPANLLARTVHLPVSPVRGSAGLQGTDERAGAMPVTSWTAAPQRRH